MTMRYKFIPLWLVIFVSFFCYSSMLTMFVPLFQDQVSPLYIVAYSAQKKNILVGIFLALYPLGQFLGSPIIGSLSDKFGRKKILLLSLAVTLLCMLLMAYSIFVKSLILLGIACFIAGLGESNMALALSAIADLTTSENRSNAFAKAWVMCSLGYISGSMFGGIAAFTGYICPFLLESGLVMSTLICTSLFLADKQISSEQAQLKQILLNFISVFYKSELRPYYLANFLAYIACFGILRVELIYMQEHFLLSQLEIAIFYSYASVIAMFANFIITPWLLKSMTVRRIILTAGVAAFLSGIIFIIPSQKTYLWVTTALIGLFIPITVAMTGALISGKASIERQGAVMGNNQSLQVLAEAVSASAGGVIFAINQQAPFIIFTLIGISSLRIYKNLRH